MERKGLNLSLDLKAISNGIVAGYASVFNNVDSYGDRMIKGAFKKSLENRHPLFLLYHDTTRVIGSITKFKEDDKGLYFEAKFNLDLKDGKEAYSMVKEANINGISIGYIVKKYEDVIEGEFDDAGNITKEETVRNLNEVELYEISLVTFPANEEAKVVSVKNEKPVDIRSFEKFLRDAGYSRAEAKAIACNGFDYKGKEAERLRDAQRQELLQDVNNLLENLRG